MGEFVQSDALKNAKNSYRTIWAGGFLLAALFSLVQHADRALLFDGIGSAPALSALTSEDAVFSDPFATGDTSPFAMSSSPRNIGGILPREPGRAAGPVPERLASVLPGAVPGVGTRNIPRGLAPDEAPAAALIPGTGDAPTGTTNNSTSDGNGNSGSFVGPSTGDGGGGSITTPTAVETPPVVIDPVTPVPEPAQWAMLLIGFAIIGSAMRFKGLLRKSSTLV